MLVCNAEGYRADVRVVQVEPGRNYPWDSAARNLDIFSKQNAWNGNRLIENEV